jgi:hypothetical protein
MHVLAFPFLFLLPLFIDTLSCINGDGVLEWLLQAEADFCIHESSGQEQMLSSQYQSSSWSIDAWHDNSDSTMTCGIVEGLVPSMPSIDSNLYSNLTFFSLLEHWSADFCQLSRCLLSVYEPLPLPSSHVFNSKFREEYCSRIKSQSLETTREVNCSA